MNSNPRVLGRSRKLDRCFTSLPSRPACSYVHPTFNMHDLLSGSILVKVGPTFFIHASLNWETCCMAFIDKSVLLPFNQIKHRVLKDLSCVGVMDVFSHYVPWIFDHLHDHGSLDFPVFKLLLSVDAFYEKRAKLG